MNYDLKEVCKDIRCDILTSIGHLGVGHIGGCLSIVEALAVLYFKEMNIKCFEQSVEHSKNSIDINYFLMLIAN